MLDEQGRLWGKVNIIDLLVVLILVAGLAFYGLTRGGQGLSTVAPTAEVTITVESEPVHPGVGEDLKVGDEFVSFNGSTTQPIGKITKVEILPYPSRAPVDGKLVVAADPVQKMVRITAVGKGTVGENVITMNTQKVMMNARFSITSDRSFFLVAVRELQIKGAK